MTGGDLTSMLAGVRMFEGLSKRELRAVAALGKEIEVRTGTPVAEEGTEGDDLYLVLRGELEVRVQGRKRRVLGPGEHFGELALLAPGPRTATVVAASPTLLLRLDRSALRELIARSPGIAVKMLRAVAGRLRATQPLPASRRL